MSNPVHHIRIAVDGLAKEIGERVAAEQQKKLETAGETYNVPPAYDFGASIIERHAKAVLLDYLLGDFNPTNQRGDA